MKKVILQYWEESERGWGIRPDGCSLHISENDLKNFVDSIYKKRNTENIPYEYDRVVGNYLDVLITENIYNEIILNGGSLRLPQHSMSNLRKLKELQPIMSYDTLN